MGRECEADPATNEDGRGEKAWKMPLPELLSQPATGANVGRRGGGGEEIKKGGQVGGGGEGGLRARSGR